MPDIDLNQRLNFASKLAREAGALAMSYFSDLASLTIQSKGVQDMATEADINTENMIRERIASRYPEDAFFGEESSCEFRAEPEQGIWVVDPIDGTHPFISGMPYWCISIAYLKNNRVELGVIYDPNRNEMFTATHNGGSFLNNKPIKASASQGVNDGLTGIGYSTRVRAEQTLEPLGRLIRAQGVFHRNGSGALSIAYVACGRLIAYFEPHMNAWDCLAGILLVVEAGGKSDNYLRDESVLTIGNRVIVAAAGVYNELEEIVNGTN